MTLPIIGLMIAAALAAWLFRGARHVALLFVSVAALYAMQPERSALAAALPALTILLVVGVWWLVTQRPTLSDLRLLALLGILAVLGALVVLPADMMISGRLAVLGPFALVGIGALGVRAALDGADEAARRRLALGFIALIVILFAILKTPFLKSAASGALHLPIAWDWLGFSYIAFRLLHVLLDYRIGRLQTTSLRDFALYMIFFPAIPAGPIARLEQFTKELSANARLDSARLLDGGTRIGIGLFKKFALADTLVYAALNEQFAAQNTSALAMWLALYAFAFRLYFDFSGYVDIAIGIGRLAGINLPENFANPYASRNIQQFWNSWHITLSMWFRTYFFLPFSRFLMATPLRASRLLTVLVAQVATMVLIGLWHGVSLNFVLWGAWNGIGLWLHRTLSERLRVWDAFVNARPALAWLVRSGSVLVTFHYVAIGWVFFALADPNLIGRALATLVGGEAI